MPVSKREEKERRKEFPEGGRKKEALNRISPLFIGVGGRKRKTSFTRQNQNEKRGEEGKEGKGSGRDSHRTPLMAV